MPNTITPHPFVATHRHIPRQRGEGLGHWLVEVLNTRTNAVVWRHPGTFDADLDQDPAFEPAMRKAREEAERLNQQQLRHVSDLRRHASRVVSLTEELRKMGQVRDETIRAAVNAGMSTRRIAEIAGVSHQRVAQIAADPA